MNQELEVAGQKDLSVLRSPVEILAEARNAALALKDVISKKKNPVIFNGEQFLEFEDLQTLGRFYGVTAKVTHSSPIQIEGSSGFEARAVAIHVPTGMEISAADSMCMNDEPNWSKKPLFQLRSMAQTRACAKALRNVLAWVVVLAGYRPTPAEEMTGQEEKMESKKVPEPAVGAVAIKSVAEKEGKRPYKITDANSVVYVTYEDKIAEYAKKAVSTGLPVVISFEKDKFGYKILDIRAAQPPPEKQAERVPGAEG